MKRLRRFICAHGVQEGALDALDKYAELVPGGTNCVGSDDQYATQLLGGLEMILHQGFEKFDDGFDFDGHDEDPPAGKQMRSLRRRLQVAVVVQSR